MAKEPTDVTGEGRLFHMRGPANRKIGPGGSLWPRHKQATGTIPTDPILTTPLLWYKQIWV